jgi:hypothetical protein
MCLLDNPEIIILFYFLYLLNFGDSLNPNHQGSRLEREEKGVELGFELPTNCLSNSESHAPSPLR